MSKNDAYPNAPPYCNPCVHCIHYVAGMMLYTCLIVLSIIICVSLFAVWMEEARCCKLVVITPRTCARGNVISFVCRCCLSLSVVSTKIARSGDLGVWVTRKYSISIDIVEKLASLCFESFGKVYERRKYCILLATPINTTHHVLMIMRTTRQQPTGIIL